MTIISSLGHCSEVFYGAHVNFGGSGSINRAKLDIIARSVSGTLSSIVLGVADSYSITAESLLQDSLFLNADQRADVLAVSREAVAKLDEIHRSTQYHLRISPEDSSVDGIPPGPAAPEVKWNDICCQDGITCSERADANKTIGLLRASCHIDVSDRD